MPSTASTAPDSDRLKKLKQQQEELAQKIRREESRLKEQARKDDTRRKILAWAVALDLAHKNPQFKALLDQALDQAIENERDRGLVGLDINPEIRKDRRANGETTASHDPTAL